jgi:DNA-binding transcriptional LysR family regulator
MDGLTIGPVKRPNGAKGLLRNGRSHMSKLTRLGWDNLRVVLEVARQGSIYSAAKILKVDHSTVTRRIANVELILEQRLFDRSNRGITARPEVQHLLEHIRMMEIHAMAMDEDIERTNENQERVVRVATMGGLASCYLARRIQEITLNDANIRIELFSNPHIVDLLKKETDIFLSFFDPHNPGLISRRIGEIAIYLYGSERYRARHGLPASRAELCRHRYVGYIPEMVTIESVRWLDQLVPAAKRVFCSNSTIAQRNAAIAGAGLVVLPAFVGEETGALFRVLPDQIRSLRSVWMSIGRDQQTLKTISQSAKAIARIFAADAKFLLGEDGHTLPREGSIDHVERTKLRSGS